MGTCIVFPLWTSIKLDFRQNAKIRTCFTSNFHIIESRILSLSSQNKLPLLFLVCIHESLNFHPLCEQLLLCYSTKTVPTKWRSGAQKWSYVALSRGSKRTVGKLNQFAL